MVELAPDFRSPHREERRIAARLERRGERAASEADSSRVLQIYILRCADGYTGLTRWPIEERLSEHQLGLLPGAYTERRRPVNSFSPNTTSGLDEAAATGAANKGLVAREEGGLHARRLAALVALAKRRPKR